MGQMTMTTSRTLTFSFDEVPLIVDGAFEDAGVSGEAEIIYWPCGDWSIDSIAIEVARAKTADELIATGNTSRRVRKMHVLDAGSPLYLILYDRLENGPRERRNIQDEVRDAIATDRADAADYRRASARYDDITLASL